MKKRYIKKWSGADVANLRIHRHDGGYGLFIGKDQVCTPAGNWVSHNQRDVVYAIAQEAWVTGALDVTNGQYYSMYATQHDMLAASFAGFVDQLPHMLAVHEVVMRPMPGPEQIEQNWSWRSVAAWLSSHGCTMPFGGNPVDATLIALLSGTLLALHPAQQTAVMSLYSRHQLSLLMALMVVLGHCNGEEYGDGCLVGNPRHPIFGMGDYTAYRNDMVTLTREAYIARSYAELMQRTR